MKDKDKDKDIIAKKDFIICQNKYFFDIKKGDDITKLPKQFYKNLITEGVI